MHFLPTYLSLRSSGSDLNLESVLVLLVYAGHLEKVAEASVKTEVFCEQLINGLYFYRPNYGLTAWATTAHTRPFFGAPQNLGKSGLLLPLFLR